MVASATLLTLVAVVIVRGGFYDVSAERAHTQVVYSLLEVTLRHSVRHHARGIEEPALTAEQIPRGAACFRAHCVSCHGAPGVAPEPAGLAMQPLPGPLVDAAAAWRARELAWITRHGIRMSGMPAWSHRLSDDDIWAIVALLLQLPAMSPADYAALAQDVADEACAHATQRSADNAPASAAGESVGAQSAGRGARQHMLERGRAALRSHGCYGCHIIPGVVGSERHVGPALGGYGLRPLIKGRLPNTADNLVDWIRDPQRLDAGSAMPATGVGEADARAMAAYLLSLR